MRKLSSYPAEYYPASRMSPVPAKTVQVHFGTLAVLLAGLCFMTPLDVHAEEADMNAPCLGNAPLVVLAKFIKNAELPPCKALSFLSGGRLKIVLPPKMLVNKLMDSVIYLAATTK